MKSLKELFTQNSIQQPKRKIGICLSGGGALGFAHIGVLQALEDHKIFPDVVSGSSMGSIIGSLYAAGYTPAQMLKFIEDGKLYKITNLMTFQPTFWKAGLTNHSHILALIKELIPNNSFEKLEKQMYVCVSNLTTGNWEIISRSEKLDIWIAASCSIPGVFNAMKINNMMYVDGGLLNNIPSQPLKDKCELIIGSDVIPHLTTKKTLKARDVLVKSVRVAQHQSSLPGRSLCDFLIEPEAIEKYHEFNFEAYQSIYEYGYKAATKFIGNNPEILKLQNLKEPELNSDFKINKKKTDEQHVTF
ncbi:MAG: patatin-like phospholipase family protein [Paludibacteraceae bacterium]